MKKIILLTICLLNIMVGQTKTYTLEESIKLGLENSKLIKVSNSKVAEAESKVREVSSKFFPRVALNANYTRLSDVDPFVVNLPFAASPIKIQDAILNNYSFKATLTQPLFTGFRLSSIKKSAEYISEASKVENQDEANKVGLVIKKTYWNFIKGKKIQQLFEERIKSISNHLKDSEQYLDNGLITKNELLKLQVLLSQTKIKLLEAENNLELTRKSFNQLLGFELNHKSDVTEELFFVNLELHNYDDLKTEALKNRSEFKSANLRIKAASENIKIEESDYYPQINLFASANYDNPNQRIMPLKDEFNETWSAGISLSWNLFNWGETSAKKQQATEKYNQVELKKNLLKEKIEVEVYKNYLRLITENKKVEVAALQVKQTEENYRIISKKYSEHLTSGSELSDAETDLTDAKIKLLNTKIDKAIAQEELKKSLGRKLY